jgi:hypothetical protein
MHAPNRGGTRGGRDQFSWEDVKADKDRVSNAGRLRAQRTATNSHADLPLLPRPVCCQEAYLGHTLMAPVGKWRQGKDLLWYSREGEQRQQLAGGRQAQQTLEQTLKEEREQIRREEENKRRAILGLSPLRLKAEQSQHETTAKQEETGGDEQRQRRGDGKEEAAGAAVSSQRLLMKGSFVGGSYRAEPAAGGRPEPMDLAVFAEAEQRQPDDGSRRPVGHEGRMQDVLRDGRTKREGERQDEREERRERRRSRRQRRRGDSSSEEEPERRRRRRSREPRARSRSRSPARSAARRSASRSSSSSPSQSRSSRRRRHKGRG